VALSNELISQFVKATKDDKKTNTETTVYGTTVVLNGVTYVKLDGSDLLTPVSKTVDAKSDERVAVMIKNHTATITGNLTSPSARTGDVNDIGTKVTDVEILVADRATVKDLQAEAARIDSLVAENVTIKEQLTANSADISNLEADTVTINEKLTAAEADITKLNTDKLSTAAADITYATISSLDALEADVRDLEATYGDFKDLTAEDLEAINATIKNLDGTYATIEELDVERGRIDDLEANSLTANHAIIKNLEANVADIDTLIFGSATGDTIQTSFANAVIAQLGDAQIKSAMIESVSASKITAGDIITNNVRVKSEDGSLLISDETMQISDETRVRVQIGKDASGDYSINIWDQNGDLMFSKGGITDSAIKDAIIRNDMVSDTANIAAHKLDIDSLFEEINGSTKTIKATRVHLDEQNQALDVAFKTMETDVSGLSNTVSTHGTQITAIQGAISSKVWQQDINRAVDNIEVSGRNLYIIKDSVEGFLITSSPNLGVMDIIRNEHTSDYVPVREGEEYIFQVWTTVDDADTVDPNLWMGYELYDADKNFTTLRPSKRSMNKLPNGQCYDIFEIAIPTGVAYLRVSARLYSDGLVKLEKGNVPTEWSPAPEDIDGDIATLSTRYSEIEQTVNSISATVAEHNSTVNEVTNKFTSLEQNVNGFKTTVSNTYATKTEMTNTETRLNTAIETSANGIRSSVSSTYATKDSVNKVKIGGRNLYIVKDAVDGYLSSSGDGTLTASGPVTKEKTSGLIAVTPGDDMRFQVWVTTPDTSYIWYAYQFFNEDGTVLNVNLPALHLYDTTGGFYHAIYDPIVVPEGAVYMRVSARLFEDGRIKVEVGNKPTDWTPAPEDMATADDAQAAHDAANTAHEAANNAETLVQQLSDSIAMLVTDGNGTSLMTQTEDGWTFSTAEIQANAAKVAEDLHTLTSEVSDNANAVDVLKQAVADLGEIAEYVKIGTYDGEPCIELGESDSEFKMRITNTRILFMEGSNVVAHISNQSLHIKKAVIEEELQQGGFVWKVRSNGNMGLVWKGVSS
jgi:uncharacterized coiled-coil protein SlyX